MDYDAFNNDNILTNKKELLKEVFSWIELVNEHCAIIVWNDLKEIVYVSNNISNIIDNDVNELYGDKWLNVLPESAVNDIYNILKKQRYKNSETTVICYIDDNSIRNKYDTIEVAGHYYYICEMKVISYVTRLEKEVKNLQKGLIHLEKMALTGEISAGLIHEIRNPLTSLKGFLQLVQAGIEQKEQYYNVMIQEIEKIESITNQLLTMSTPIKEQKQNECLKQMIDETVIIIKLQSKFNELTFDVNCSEHSFIYCNKQQIKQVLINLLKNAAEAMDMKGNIIINVLEVEQSTILQIIDEGQGVKDEIIYEIDKPFYTTKETGTGLGLVITKQILDLHNATLHISSKYGEGSKFEIAFPHK